MHLDDFVTPEIRELHERAEKAKEKLNTMQKRYIFKYYIHRTEDGVNTNYAMTTYLENPKSYDQWTREDEANFDYISRTLPWLYPNSKIYLTNYYEWKKKCKSRRRGVFRLAWCLCGIKE